MTPDLFDKIEAVHSTLPGWCQREKWVRMCNGIMADKPAAIVEIGVFGGSSLLPMAVAASTYGGIVYGIDPWAVEPCLVGMEDKANRDWWQQNVDLETIYRDLTLQVAKLGLQNVELIRQTSDATAFVQPIGLLHIDGNHSYEPCRRDFRKWIPMVKAGGVVVCDDVGWSEGGKPTVLPNVEMALAELGCRRICDDALGCAWLEKVV